MHMLDILPTIFAEIERVFAKDEAFAITCSVGHRASLAVSILRRRGFKNVFNLLGGMTAWGKQKLPTEKGPSSKVPLDEKSIEKDHPNQEKDRHANKIV